ncbi:hypothetical protein [Neobacillus terrae]|uniref:hypothetical protein n=1 Tax=Neobacillus terrae TaxID=3034837 RepID=UPI00140AD003|nr:hypothetical protein [Neobacillus terrae]NHM31211.1 hypothetical protein [Neobacillus terrae]
MRHLLLLLILTGFLAGFCNEPSINRDNKKNISEAVHLKEKTLKSKTPSAQLPKDNDFSDSGDSISSFFGTLTLKKNIPINKLYLLDGIEYIVNDIKIIHFQPAPGREHFFRKYTNLREFDFIKMNVEMVNTKPKTVKFTPIISLDADKVFISGEKDIYQEKMSGNLKGGETKKGNIGFILPTPYEQVNQINITSSAVRDLDNIVKKSPVSIQVLLR